MNQITKLVLVRHHHGGKAYLFEAPVEAPILEGDTVVCKTRNGRTTYGIAVAILIVPMCCTEYRFICTASDAVEPLSQVVGKYEKIKF